MRNRDNIPLSDRWDYYSVALTCHHARFHRLHFTRVVCLRLVRFVARTTKLPYDNGSGGVFRVLHFMEDMAYTNKLTHKMYN